MESHLYSIFNCVRKLLIDSGLSLSIFLTEHTPEQAMKMTEVDDKDLKSWRKQGVSRNAETEGKEKAFTT